MTTTSTIAFRSPLRYPGGKSRALRMIAPMLPHGVAEYREPMVGGGSVFFHARNRGLAERYWINDGFTDLAVFWMTVQDATRCAQLQQRLRTLRTKLKTAAEVKDQFHRWRASAPADDFERALRFFFFNRVTFSGTTQAGGFSSEAAQKRFTHSSIDRLGCLPEALAGVRITNDDFQPVVSTPGDDVLIFLDPPYFTSERLYGAAGRLHDFDHQRLAECLRASPHRFLITYDDCAQIRDLYSWAHVREWQLQYGMDNCGADGSPKRGRELFIFNYDPPG